MSTDCQTISMWHVLDTLVAYLHGNDSSGSCPSWPGGTIRRGGCCNLLFEQPSLLIKLVVHARMVYSIALNGSLCVVCSNTAQKNTFFLF